MRRARRARPSAGRPPDPARRARTRCEAARGPARLDGAEAAGRTEVAEDAGRAEEGAGAAAPAAAGPGWRAGRGPTHATPRPRARPRPSPVCPDTSPARAVAARRRRPARAPAAAAAAPQPAAGVRIAKLITERGIASRREADEWIAAGWVRCEGRVAVLGQRVAPDATIEIDPRAQRAQARRVTVLLNKPLGYVSGQAEDGHEPAAVLVTPANRWHEDPSRVPLHAGQLRGLAPAGRLDIDSTGLLVLTQDGRIAKLLIGEQTRVEKEYLVRVRSASERPAAEADLGLLRHGLELDGQPLKPAQVSWANEDQLRFVLREGRKRQIRRMCELVGLQVVALKRVRIGSVVLGALPPGQWRLLGEHERF
ncbi:MAG: rRNA pseudouridine synthase [Rubrivivax sp.]|nr:rRNA pseudouridine synthase [Rubrivivax sp.]